MERRTATGQHYTPGGAIPALSGALLLARDGGVPGERMTILEGQGAVRVSLDGSGDPQAGYLARGGRMFEPRFLGPDASRYLVQPRSVGNGILHREEFWIANFPPHGSGPTPVRSGDPVTLRSVAGAIRRSEALEVKCQYLSSLNPPWRWIAPHAIAFDGFRWHTRAFCLSDECFRDFLLSRILDIRGSRESQTSADDDREWHAEVTLEVGPHPDLSETEAKVVALDYGMRGGNTKIKDRRALLYYALKRLGLDTDPTARRPQDQKVLLLKTFLPSHQDMQDAAHQNSWLSLARDS